MKKNLLLLITFLLLIFGRTFGQFFDDFSDGNFSTSPRWEGDTGDFRISLDLNLQLFASAGGTSALWVPTSYSHYELEWRVRVKIDCSPSANNYVRIYLLSDGSLHNENKKAFFLQLGENLSNDAIELFYEDDNQLTSICRGRDGRIANSFEMDIKVTKDSHSIWKIWVDEELMGDYTLDASGFGRELFENAAVGIYCQYTTSNKNKFFFDNFYFGPPQIDTTSPEVLEVVPSDNFQEIIVHFSENVTPISSLDCTHYSVVEWGEQPIQCQFVLPNYHQIRLTFSSTFKPRTPYHLVVSEIEDHAGNQLESSAYPFVFQSIRRNEVIINEIMADPYPVVGLPPSEYIELHNRLDTTAILSGWKLQTGNYMRDIPDLSIPAQGFALLVPVSSSSLFSDSILIAPLSLMNITDAGQWLILYNEFGEVVHFVNFSKKWHEYSYKAEGGWSLEMIDPNNPCGGNENWRSSIDEAGGTPGKVNSVNRDNADDTEPDILRVVVMDSMTLKVVFSEAVIIDENKNMTLFTMDRNLEIASIEEVPPENTTLIITLFQSMKPNLIYTLIMMDTLCDCAGNMVVIGTSFLFGRSHKVESNDLIINEVLSNPYGTQDADFIEIYNRSNKILDLRTVRIGSGDTPLPDKAIQVSTVGYDLFPAGYVALCKNPALTMESYFCPYPKRLLPCDSLPNFPNSKGVVHLVDLNFQQIDRFAYDESMHYPLLNSVDGVSLERINPEAETQNPHNWKSAAESAGFATPGYQNSQFATLSEVAQILEITPSVFSPNNDGFDDFTQLHCRFPTTENRVLIQIFNKEGQFVKTVVNNSIVAANATFTWDGTNELHALVPPDLYIVRLQYWLANGKTNVLKASVGVVYRQ